MQRAPQATRGALESVLEDELADEGEREHAEHERHRDPDHAVDHEHDQAGERLARGVVDALVCMVVHAFLPASQMSMSLRSQTRPMRSSATGAGSWPRIAY